VVRRKQRGQNVLRAEKKCELCSAERGIKGAHEKQKGSKLVTGEATLFERTGRRLWGEGPENCASKRPTVQNRGIGPKDTNKTTCKGMPRKISGGKRLKKKGIGELAKDRREPCQCQSGGTRHSKASVSVPQYYESAKGWKG